MIAGELKHGSLVSGVVLYSYGPEESHTPNHRGTRELFTVRQPAFV